MDPTLHPTPYTKKKGTETRGPSPEVRRAARPLQSSSPLGLAEADPALRFHRDSWPAFSPREKQDESQPHPKPHMGISRHGLGAVSLSQGGPERGPKPGTRVWSPQMSPAAGPPDLPTEAGVAV